MVFLAGVRLGFMGMYRGISLIDDYEFYEAYGADPAVVLTFGTSSDAYAEARWDCFTLVSEVPCFTSPRIADQSPTGLTRREAKLRGQAVCPQTTQRVLRQDLL